MKWIDFNFRGGVRLHSKRDLGGLRVHFDLCDIETAAFDSLDRAGNVLLAKIARCPLCHGAPHRLVCLPVRSALTGSRRSCAATSAVWNARSRIDRLVMRARGGKPLGSSGFTAIHIAM